MPRIRTVKPEFFTSEQIVACSYSARLLFIGLWNYSDDAGVHPASYKRLKMEVFPGDDCSVVDIQNWITELIKQELLIEYEAIYKDRLTRFWQVTGWYHQKIDRPNYKFPGKGKAGRAIDSSVNNQGKLVDDSTKSRQALDVCHPPEGNVREKECSSICEVVSESLSNLSNENLSKTTTGDIDNVFYYWQAVMNKPKAKLDSKRRGVISRALKSYSIEQLKLAIDGCVGSKYHMGDNEAGKTYNDIELIVRDAKHVEQFMGYQQASLLHAGCAVDSELMQGVM